VRVRRRVRAALRRGLAPDPAARFASLDELLAELAPPPRRTARWAIGLAGAVAAGALVLTWSAEAPDQRCTGAAAAFATAWHPAQRAAIAAAFTRTGAPYAPTALSRVTDALDHYGARWTQAHTDACRATRILGEQTDAILELRMTCLERRRQEVAALVGALATANADAVARSVTAALGLVDVAACADLAALRQFVAPPTDVARRARLDGLTPRLAEARASFETGAFDRAQQLIGPVVAEARALAYRPFEAEALFLEGEIEHAKGNRASEEATYQAAVWAAEAGGHDEVAARAWARLVYVIGYDKAEFARGLALAPLVTAKLAKLGGNAAIEAELEHSTAGVVLAQGNPESAIAHVRKAIDIADHAFGPDHAKVAIELLALGSVLANEGRPASAVPILQRAYDIRARAMGPDHPDTLTVLNALANAHNDTGHPAQAEQELRRALALREAALGSQHPMLVYNLANLATALDDQGKTEEAVALDHRAVALAENVFGPEHLRLGILLVDAAVHLGHLGRLREARDQLQRADAIFTKLHGAHAIESQFVQVVRGDLRFRESRWADAAALYEQAIPVLEGAHIVHNEVTVAVIHLGLAGLALHQPARGLPALERLAARLDEVRPDLRVAAEFTLARALWESGRDRKRARELASHALAAAHQLPGAHRDDAAQIERWLAHH
jgi:tetratricopeptide (TPR) repeat protein